MLELNCRDKFLSLKAPILMGILNVTPDSFSDGGQFFSQDAAVQRAFQMIEECASIIDVGGESTGPGSVDVSAEEELKRVIPVIQKIRERNTQVWISIDTWKSEVAKQAIQAGADMVNDVTALRGDPQMVSVIAEYKVPLILMYSKDSTPRTTREKIQYDDVVNTIREFLEQRIEFAQQNGIDSSQIIVDPGMGAFVSGEARYSLEILKRLNEFKAWGFPILIGASRKGFISEICGGKGSGDRLEGSLAAALIAMMNGANILRVHDVKKTKRVVDFLNPIERGI